MAVVDFLKIKLLLDGIEHENEGNQQTIQIQICKVKKKTDTTDLFNLIVETK